MKPKHSIEAGATSSSIRSQNILMEGRLLPRRHRALCAARDTIANTVDQWLGSFDSNSCCPSDSVRGTRGRDQKLRRHASVVPAKDDR